MDASAGPSSSNPRKSRPKPSDLLEYTWYIKVIHEGTPFHAGAICVHPDGFLITVTHGICLFGAGEYPSVEARRHNETFRVAEVIDSSVQFGLLLLKVEKTMDGENFKAFPTSSDTSIDPQKTIPIHGFIFQGKVPFSYVFGTTSYLYPNNLRVPRRASDAFTYDGDFTGRTISSFTGEGEDGEARTIWSPADLSMDKKRRSLVGDGIYKLLEMANGTIPLLQVSGLDVHLMDGQLGWPVFTADNKVLLGLIFLTTETQQFVIPAQLVHEMLRLNLNRLR